MKCNDCQTLLLDHLYGLLDAAETAAVEAHLAGCPACSAARSQAARTQGLLAQAAKSEFPRVRFTPPVEPPTIPFSKRPTRRGEWVRWAVAASVLALIPGTLLPLSKLTDRYENARRDADDAAVRLADARIAFERERLASENPERLANAKDRYNRVIAEWVAAEKVEQDRKVAVEVTRPVSAQPGAPAEFFVSVADPAQSLQGSSVEAQFRDQSGLVMFSQKIDPKQKASVRLPAEVWSRVTPQSELYLNVSAVNATGVRTEIQEPIRLFGPVYATMLATDKSTYRPGDRLFFRSLTLDRITFRPPSREQKLQFVLRKQSDPEKVIAFLTGSTRIVKETSGVVETVTDHEGKPIRGVGCGEFVLPADLADGEFTLTLTELVGPGGAPPVMAYPVTRTIKVRSGAPERFLKKITFKDASYTPGPGQTVTAIAELKLGEMPVAGAIVKAVAIADDKPVAPVIITPKETGPDGKPLFATDKTGRVQIVFPLVQPLARGDVKLMVTFTKDGVEESVAERVNIAGKDITIEFFPEGGKLIAGVPNRIYVRGTNSTGKPVDVRGTIVEGIEKTEIVAKVESPTHDEPIAPRGLGSFTFTPKADTVYRLRLQAANPASKTPTFDLPKAEAEGVVFTALDTVTKPGQPIRLRVHSVGKDRNLVVGAYTRGRLADTQKVNVKAGASAIVTLLATADARGGVTRITVFEESADKSVDLVPVAERLVFRKPGEALNLTASAGPSAAFAPGSAIDLSIAATDEKGNPVPAILWAAAVNTAVAPGAKDRSLATHFLLAGEVQTPDELEFADFLLTEHPKAAEALDHVLATQGWRRFVEQRGVSQPGSPHADLLKLHGQHNLVARAGVSRDGGKVYERFWTRFEQSASELDAAQRAKDATIPVVGKLYSDLVETRRTTAALAENVRTVAEPLEQIRDRLTLAASVVAILTIMLGLLAMARGLGFSSAAPYFLGTIAAAGLAIYLTIDAKEHPTSVPDEVGALPAPPVFRGAPAKAIVLPPMPADPVVNEPVDLPSAEPLVVHTLGQVLVFPARANPIMPKPSIPAGLFDPPRPPGGVRTLHPDVVKFLTDANNAAREKALAHGDQHAVSLLRKLETNGVEANGSVERIRSAVPRTPPFVVREYAAPRPASNDTQDADTVLWQPVIVLPADGKTTLRFHLGNAPGGYQVIVAGHTADGRFGSIRTVLPITPTP